MHRLGSELRRANRFVLGEFEMIVLEEVIEASEAPVEQDCYEVYELGGDLRSYC